ncbi:MAG TPA: oligosaccharide flippase family protein, partial [Pyrinomonadaceae bacterium]|nr:oligosaccharide flippase family protein [Pyrinomonadaceae bacterium]
MTSALNEMGGARPARQLMSGTLRVFAAEALIVPTGILTAVFLSRRFGPEGYGLLTLAGVVIAWVESNVATALSRPVVKLVADSKDWRAVASASLRLYLACGVALAALLAAVAEPVALSLGEGPQLAFYLRLYALEIPVFCAAQAHRSVLVGLGRFRERAWATAARWTARLALVVALVIFTGSIAAAICASVLASVVELLFCRARLRVSLFGAGGARRLGGYALPLVASALCLSLFGRLDLLLLKALGGTAADAGLYGVAQNLALLPTLFSFAFAPTLLSTLGRAAREGDAEGAREVAATALRAPLVLAPFAACVAGASGEVVRLLFGAQFAGAATPLGLLLFASLALVLVSAAASMMTAAGRASWTLHAAWPPLVVAAALHAYAIPRAGAAGAAAVTAGVA